MKLTVLSRMHVSLFLGGRRFRLKSGNFIFGLKEKFLQRRHSVFPMKNRCSYWHFPMEKLVYFILLGIFSCDQPRKANDGLPGFPDAGDRLMTYEGKIPLDEKTNLYVELSLSPSDQPGEGTFRLEEFLESENGRSKISFFEGRYSTLIGDNPDERIMQLYNTAHDRPLRRKYVIRRFNGTDSQRTVLREEPFRQSDLILKIQGTEKLIVLDKELQALSTEREHNLIRRTSRVFTVEGYFRHNGDSADFYEMNTGDVWPVSKLGDYHKAIKQYYQLTERKFQATYMKATGFSINHVNKEGIDTEALVIRKVVQMTSTTQEFPQKRPRGPNDL